jgi:hypothetical protein
MWRSFHYVAYADTLSGNVSISLFLFVAYNVRTLIYMIPAADEKVFIRPCRC